MADAPFVWDELGKYKAEGRFLDGYPEPAPRPRRPATARLTWPRPPAGSCFGVDWHRPEREA